MPFARWPVQPGGAAHVESMNGNPKTVAIPTLDTGLPPEVIYVSTDVGNAASFAIGNSTVSATTNPQWQQNRANGLYVNARGHTHISWGDFAGTAIVLPCANTNRPYMNNGIGAFGFGGLNAAEIATDAAGKVAIPPLNNGDLPKFIAIFFSTTTGLRWSVGPDAGLSATTDPMGFVNRDGGCVVVNVVGQESVSWSAIAAARVCITPLDNAGGVG